MYKRCTVSLRADAQLHCTTPGISFAAQATIRKRSFSLSVDVGLKEIPTDTHNKMKDGGINYGAIRILTF
jgi:hypothetical protein